MDNYQFCVDWALNQRITPSTRILDYGCGAGHIVKALRARNVDAFGCDVFYEGGDYSKLVESEYLGKSIKRMEPDGRIPYDDETFDFVINNQVMEHVTDLDKVLSEIHRVLKPGGKVLSLFPDKSVWREGHCGIPFLHWFPKGSRPRIYYAALMRLLGFGYHKENKTIMRWSADFCEWLDKWTWYRPSKDIRRSYQKYFTNENELEGYWLSKRLDKLGSISELVPLGARKLVVRKLGGRIFVVEKGALNNQSA
ncbi:MAG TPA: class I SAM-dependent methyltransferase [Noviherbaspirillum sp.]|nr:class I SAM-dependent methyltransferase [Noviherbaspirillum sp.]